MRQRGRREEAEEEEAAAAAGPAGHYQAGGAGARGGQRGCPPVSSRPSAAWFPTAGSSSPPSAPWLRTWPACWPAGRNRTAGKEATGSGGAGRGGGGAPGHPHALGTLWVGAPADPRSPSWPKSGSQGVPRGLGVPGESQPPQSSWRRWEPRGEEVPSSRPALGGVFRSSQNVLHRGGGASRDSLLLFLMAQQPGTFHPPLPSVPQPGREDSSHR